MTDSFDAVVVGAGPYGLSAGAHLRGKGLRVAVFGKPMGMWRDNMPEGMILRSHWWATNLSDPRRKYGFARFFDQSPTYARGYPQPVQAFIDYGLWFKERAVPDVDETYVSSIERQGNRFLLTLADGRLVDAGAVVMATGPRYYATRPQPFTDLPRELVSHSSDHANFRCFAGKDVVVIGGGQSAIESAALLHEAGARVEVVARRRIWWLGADPGEARTLLQRLRAPNAGVAPGWKNWVLDHFPYLFFRLPQRRKDNWNSNYESGASHWLRDRVIGKVVLHEWQTVTSAVPTNGKLDLAILDGAKLSVDHVVLGTGYKVDVSRLTMLHPSLRAGIQTNNEIPVLNHWFESSVPGLYFIGLTSLRAFGPVYRFVAGAPAAARRVARAVARRRAWS